MKKISETVCIALLFVSGAACNLLDKHDGGTSRNQTGRSDSTQTGGGEASLYDTVIYAAGVRFPDGYDWQIDTMAEREKGELVLLKNEEVIASVPVGYNNNISADPDMFRIAEGHLFTDFSSTNQTIIKCDGKELFRYDSREQMCGFAVSGNDVWTLGQDRSGDGGLSLRKNGQTVYAHPSGYIIGNLSDTYNPRGALDFIDGEPVFFYYYIAQGALSRSVHCIMVKGDKETEIEIPRNFTRILDAKVVEGVPLLAGQIGSSRNIISTVRNGAVVGFTLQGYDKIGNCKILPVSGGELLLYGECFYGGLVSGYICDRNGNNLFYDIEGRLIGLYASEGVDVILSCGENGADPAVTTNGRSKSISGRYLYISPKSAVLFDNKFYIGLNPAGGEGPFIQVGNKKTPLNFNGFVSEINISLIKKENNDN